MTKLMCLHSHSAVLPRTYDNQACSIARTLELIGDRWTLLIIRDAFMGVRRFEVFQRSLGIARNVLTDRLDRLVEAGILRRELYQERPDRYEYRLTRKGVDLWPVIITTIKWGDKHVAEHGPPVLIRHKDCGGDIDQRLHCTVCGAELTPNDVYVERGPGARDVAA
jgi:DNA-binding HxlR family transcriptional regulator